MAFSPRSPLAEATGTLLAIILLVPPGAEPASRATAQEAIVQTRSQSVSVTVTSQSRRGSLGASEGLLALNESRNLSDAQSDQRSLASASPAQSVEGASESTPAGDSEAQERWLPWWAWMAIGAVFCTPALVVLLGVIAGFTEGRQMSKMNRRIR